MGQWQSCTGYVVVKTGPKFDRFCVWLPIPRGCNRHGVCLISLWVCQSNLQFIDCCSALGHRDIRTADRPGNAVRHAVVARAESQSNRRDDICIIDSV